MANNAQQLQQALRNGYSGPTVQRGNDLYTPGGSLLRNDGFQYPEGAKISPNGMYVDTGSGWQYAGGGSMAGAAPGARVSGFEGATRGNTQTPATPVAPETPAAPEPQTPNVPTAEMEQWWKKLFGY